MTVQHHASPLFSTPKATNANGSFVRCFKEAVMLGHTFVSRCDVRRGLAERLHASAGGSTLRPFLARAAALALLAALLIAPPLTAQRGARVLHRNIAQLVQNAEYIFRGEVTEAFTEPHPQFSNLQTVVVTLRIVEAIKGNLGAAYTFRQYLSDPRDIQGKLDYRPGQQYFLLMLKPSQYGLSSPSGHEQGRFRIITDAQGNVLVRNGFDNIRLMERIDQTMPSLKAALNPATQARVAKHHRGPIPYDDLKSIIRGAIAAGN
ncbi:MAG: hypothetical protein ACRD6I_20740 [Candidatus Acidiferrales bacterium]